MPDYQAHAAAAHAAVLRDLIEALLPASGLTMLREYDDERGDALADEHDGYVDELARHFPSLAVAMLIVWRQHVAPQRIDQRGVYCTESPA